MKRGRSLNVTCQHQGNKITRDFYQAQGSPWWNMPTPRVDSQSLMLLRLLEARSFKKDCSKCFYRIISILLPPSWGYVAAQVWWYILLCFDCRFVLFWQVQTLAAFNVQGTVVSELKEIIQCNSIDEEGVPTHQRVFHYQRTVWYKLGKQVAGELGRKVDLCEYPPRTWWICWHKTRTGSTIASKKFWSPVVHRWM